MRPHTPSVRAALSAGLMLLALSACQKNEGPAERAGKEVDKAVANVGQQIEKTGDSIENAAKKDKK